LAVRRSLNPSGTVVTARSFLDGVRGGGSSSP
jgi:hypothetical protein